MMRLGNDNGGSVNYGMKDHPDYPFICATYCTATLKKKSNAEQGAEVRGKKKILVAAYLTFISAELVTAPNIF